MMTFPLRMFHGFAALTVLSSVILLPVTRANAYTPEHPEVQALVNQGMSALQARMNEKTVYSLTSAFTGGFGEHALAGYAAMKVDGDATNPVVRQGIAAARRQAQMLSDNDPGSHSSKTVYAAAVATLLLAEVDPKRYRSELEKLERYFRSAQYPNGAYGYANEPTGDVSQTQYAMLALWTLDRAGIRIDYKGMASTIAWLLRVQDPSGGWPYQAKDPGGGRLIAQTGVTPSMAVAGGSALLIASDILDLWGTSLAGEQTPEGMPKAVKIANLSETDAIRKPNVPIDPIINSIKACDGYLNKNTADVGAKISEWPYYQLYTLERYESFREVALASETNPSPEWYNAGVRYLKEKSDGSGWPRGAYTTASTSTSFAILFLIRSTKKSILKNESGTLAGGWKLPSDTTKIVVDGTQIKGEPVSTSVSDLLSVLEEDDGGALEGKSLPENMTLSEDPTERKAQIDRLSRLLRGSQSWQARRVAARVLGQSDEIRVVPVLIYALSDPDTQVKLFARDGLRFISRKFEGFGMPRKPTYTELRKAQNQWREWYLTMDPGYVFLE